MTTCQLKSTSQCTNGEKNDFRLLTPCLVAHLPLCCAGECCSGCRYLPTTTTCNAGAGYCKSMLNAESAPSLHRPVWFDVGSVLSLPRQQRPVLVDDLLVLWPALLRRRPQQRLQAKVHRRRGNSSFRCVHNSDLASFLATDVQHDGRLDGHRHGPVHQHGACAACASIKQSRVRQADRRFLCWLVFRTWLLARRARPVRSRRARTSSARPRAEAPRTRGTPEDGPVAR